MTEGGVQQAACRWCCWWVKAVRAAWSDDVRQRWTRYVTLIITGCLQYGKLYVKNLLSNSKWMRFFSQPMVKWIRIPHVLLTALHCDPMVEQHQCGAEEEESSGDSSRGETCQCGRRSFFDASCISCLALTLMSKGFCWSSRSLSAVLSDTCREAEQTLSESPDWWLTCWKFIGVVKHCTVCGTNLQNALGCKHADVMKQAAFQMVSAPIAAFRRTWQWKRNTGAPSRCGKASGVSAFAGNVHVNVLAKLNSNVQ